MNPKTSLIVCIAVLPPLLSAGELRVDINRGTKNQTTYTETGFFNWSSDYTDSPASGTNADTRVFTSSTGETVTVGLSQTAASAATGGLGLRTGLYQAGGDSGAKLASDGVEVDVKDLPSPENVVGEIQMTISGLAAGTHTLLTYHNHWDSPTAINLGPIDISVNGTLVVDDLQPTIRAATNNDAASSYILFTVSGPADTATILFAADPAAGGAGVTRRTAVLNGFEIDTSNSQKIAHTPIPADGDGHVDADAGTVTLSWSPALSGDTASHDIYFGMDAAAVAAANHASPLYLGNQTTTNIAVPVTDKHSTYYWRVDEVNTSAQTTPGSVWSFRPRVLAFSGAEGHGRYARGGRGGRVVHVTSLADYGSGDTPVPGTLRYAIEEETGPRVIVFDVSGLITVDHRLTLSSPFVTLAGQTAPGKGICLRKWPLGLSGSNDSVVRFLRNRPGNISGQTIDGGGLAGCDHSIMDHCSISWSMDEGFSSRSAKNITLQNTLISEALAIAGHANYPPGTDHGYAATVGGNKASLHHNLLAHCSGRNWSLGGGLDSQNNFAGRVDIRNNVVYNWRSRTTDGGAMEVNFVNNYYKPGAATTFTPYAVTMNHEDNFGGSQQCYFAGNIMQGYFNESNQTVGRRSVVDAGIPTPSYPTFVAAPFFDSEVTTQTATGAYKRVLSDVGANRPIDDHDTRVINETLSGTYTYTGTGPYGGYPGLPNTQDDVGGWEDYPSISRDAGWDSDGDGMPNWWEELHGTNPSSTPGDFTESGEDPDNDGFTRLCDYLAWMALPLLETVEATPADLDLSVLTKGYTALPVYQVTLDPASSAAGALQLLGDGKTARFTPAPGFTGIAGFSFTVTDSQGDSMDREVAIRVTQGTAPEPDPVTPVFINLSTSQGSSGATPSTASTITINAPGSGWNYSAAAPVDGTTWNNILRPNPLIGSNSTSSTGQYICNSADGIALTSPDGSPTTATLTVSLDIQDLDSNTTRTEPNSSSGGNTNLGPAGLMDQAWRIYRGGNSTVHRLDGLSPRAHCHIYFYGSTATDGQGCRFVLDPANVPSGSTSNFLETRGGNSGNIFVNSGTLSLTSQAPANTASTPADSHTWGRLHAVVDSNGTLVFRTAKNSANGQYLNGYQIVAYPPSGDYDDYCAYYGLDPQSDGAPGEDAENDGLSNIIEFLVGGNPVLSDLEAVSPVLTTEPGGFAFSYRRRLGAGGFASDTVETSTNLEAWSVAVDGESGVLIDAVPIASDPGFEEITVHLPASEDKAFARLKVRAAN